MSIKIGHASIDENNKASGGQAGDSTQKEVCVRTWYSKPWQYYLECTDKSIANVAATYMEQICANDNVGYDQSQRLTLYNQLKVHKDVSKLTPCECDCSSLIACCYIMAGLDINPSCTTRNIRSALISTGKFKAYSDTEHLTTDKYAKRGGLFLKEGSHIVMALENGESKPTSGYTKGIDVSSYNVVSDYQSVKNDGVQFAILKIIDKNLNVDKLFETHLNGFNKVGIPIIGVYNYSYATTVAKAKSDASTVVKYLKQYNIPKSTIVYLDVEDKCQQGLGALLIQIINAYQEVIEGVGYKFGLYTGMSFYSTYIKPYKSNLKCSTEWIARYYNGYNTMEFSQNPNESYKPNVGVEIEGWQYTSSGRVNGIDGNVDLNILYNKSSDSSTKSITNIVTASVLNVRNKPALNGNIVGTLKKGDEVTIYAYQNGWVKISQTEDKWCNYKYISSTYGIVSNCSKLNCRNGNSTNSLVNFVLSANDKVNILYQDPTSGWYYIEYNGKTGYVSNKYIKI